MRFLKSHALLLASVLLYGVSLFLPALYGGGSYLVGLVLLIFGALPLADSSSFAWLANGMYAAALIAYLMHRTRVVLVLSLLAFGVGLDTVRVDRFPLDEGGMNVMRQAFGEGFYVWEASFLLLAASAAVPLLHARKNQPPPLPPV